MRKRLAPEGTVRFTEFERGVYFEDGEIAVALRTVDVGDDELRIQFVDRDGDVVLDWASNNDLSESVAEHDLVAATVWFVQSAWASPISIEDVIAIDRTLVDMDEVS